MGWGDEMTGSVSGQSNDRVSGTFVQVRQEPGEDAKIKQTPGQTA
jgi:hypothetical protein